ncbi:hypothetical protein MUK42_34341 [Musa troglodytarum]|uniref:Uncharacterized protein n=1 Tax=Musa troglodytarum TaxID=320322 RepID=A0A9E7EAZ7_9LILI|nr:hypothetical protein MUK42_34341 [Musa troglodytarum]
MVVHINSNVLFNNFALFFKPEAICIAFFADLEGFQKGGALVRKLQIVVYSWTLVIMTKVSRLAHFCIIMFKFFILACCASKFTIWFHASVIPTDDLNCRLDPFMVLVDAAAAVPVTDHDSSNIQ